MAGLFGGPSIPTPKPAAPMPDSSSEGVLEAKKRAQADVMSRAGRSSTILTGKEDRGRMDTFASSKLGAA